MRKQVRNDIRTNECLAISEKLLMEMKTYKLRYLPLFEEDVKNVAAYISHVLQNPDAAHNLIDDVETAILNMLYHPAIYEKVFSQCERVNPYYRIYVKNYTIYYVILDDIVEIRRFLYNGRDMNRLI